MTTTKTPQLLQLQVQERSAKDTALKVRLPADMLQGVRTVQALIGQDPLIPTPSIHALILKAVGNYLVDFDKKQEES